MHIRRATADDLSACREVCLGTGNSGADAHDLFTLKEILSDIFVAPYFEFCLEFAWVLESDAGEVCGYVLGCPDNVKFEDQLQNIWWPRIRAKYEDVSGSTRDDQDCLAFIASPAQAPTVVSSRYPAHGHIDLLPMAQGSGWGGQMMSLMMKTMADQGISGMYLDVSVGNLRAQKFYSKLGFTEVVRHGESCYLGIDF